MRSLDDLESQLEVQFLFPDENRRPAWDREMMSRGSSENTTKESLLKVRGSPANVKIAIDDIEDRLRRLTQVKVHISDAFYEDINTAQCLNHLGAMQVDADIREPSNGTFECTLTGTRKEDLDIAHQEFAQMVHRLAKGLSAVHPNSDKVEVPAPTHTYTHNQKTQYHKPLNQLPIPGGASRPLSRNVRFPVSFVRDPDRTL
ncbi:hypothetical protein DL93DRAFT_450320 [Clavulina sp. PMI_390]|nr:hypothetical protein DL93DRAFT_450320 [Clavulina sp. PMI_390]